MENVNKRLLITWIGLGLLLAFACVFFILRGDSSPSGNDISESMSESPSLQGEWYSEYNNKIVRGGDLVKLIEKNYTKETFIIDAGGHVSLIGTGVDSNFELADMCGYTSVGGKLNEDIFGSDVHLIRNPNSNAYIDSGLQYQVYHICDGPDNVIGLYIQNP